MHITNHFVRSGTALAVAVSFITFSATAHAQMQAGSAVVKSVKGSASYVDALGGFHTLTVGTTLKQGDTVKTGSNGAVDLYLERNGRYVGLFEDTTLSLKKLSYQTTALGDLFDTELDLKQGRIYASVSKLLAGAHFELNTPQGRANVRGTEFYYDGKTGQIWVVSGLVHFEISLLNVAVPPPFFNHTETRTVNIPAGWTLFVTREIDMINFRNGTLLPTFRGGAPVPQSVIDRIAATPILAGHYNNPGNSEVTINGAWFTSLNPKQNVVNLIGTPALFVPSP